MASIWGKRRRVGYAFIAPVFLFLCAVVLFPLGHAFWTSLMRIRGLSYVGQRFTGDAKELGLGLVGERAHVRHLRSDPYSRLRCELPRQHGERLGQRPTLERRCPQAAD